MEHSKDLEPIVQQDMVVTLHYTLVVDGEVVEQSTGGEPIQFLQGHGQVVPGLERQIYNMAIGESKRIVVSPGEGYGELDLEAYAVVPRDEFSSEIPLEEGVVLQMRDADGDIFDAHIQNVKADKVYLDFNHPLAGKELRFTVDIVDIRPAISEEIDHGHVHDQEIEK